MNSKLQLYSFLFTILTAVNSLAIDNETVDTKLNDSHLYSRRVRIKSVKSKNFE